jgi:mono/diheme cytochrome c family protein
MQQWRIHILAATIGVFVTANPASAADSAAGFQFFESKIRPVLAANCYGCHSPKAEKIKGDFLLDTRAGIRRGGASERDAVIPGDIAGSQLIEAIRYGNGKLQMPPKGKLSDSVIADFEKWIGMGAPDPRDGVSKLPRELAAENHWAWKKPHRRLPPKVKRTDWPHDSIDRFILAKLEANSMQPNPDADRRTLIRRATLELTGLTPSVEEIRALLLDRREISLAFADVVDRLLADAGFGVRWGRHWLDVARYGESSGYSRNMLFPYAWRYRNYVIDSYNADKPFDRFIREQIAGDLLSNENQAQAEDQILGTAFLTVGAKTFNEGNLVLFNLNCADDQIDVTSRAFLALTVNCARCHDHKYDPIPTRDYYAMAGIFQSSRNLAGSETNVRNEHSEAFPLGPDGARRLTDIEAAKAKSAAAQAYYMELVKKRNTLREPLVKKGINWKKNPTPELAAAEARVQAQQDVVKETRLAIPNPPEYAMAVVEGMQPDQAVVFDKMLKAEKDEIAAMKKAGKKPKDPTPGRPKIADSPLFEKGLHDSPLATVPRGALSLFDYQTPAIGTNQSGRRQLAEWIANPRNPLTARVYVNRIWHHLFGRGLVETTDNFGALGAAPSHVELLDTLAMDFIDDGWSTKRLIRRIMLSRTWCQSSANEAAFATTDPDTRLLWRFPPQLLEGEAIRDCVLSIGGRLDPVHLQTSQVAEISKQQALGRQREIGRRDYYMKDVTWDVRHRSVYLPMPRGVIPDMLATFDAADPNLVVGARKLTIVPTQALYLANSGMVVEESVNTAKRILEYSPERRLAAAYELILGRFPTEDEKATVERFLAGADDVEKNWARVCQTLICSGEFRTIY